MEVTDAIRARKSVRSYEDKEVPEDALSRILEAGRIAPSANNAQPWHFVVVKDPQKRKILSEGRYAHFLSECPIVIVGCGDAKRSPKWYTVDVTIALDHMVLAATNEGLGTCWIGSFDEESVRKALGVPDDFKVVAMLALGYAREKLDIAAKLMRTRNRRSSEETFSREKF